MSEPVMSTASPSPSTERSVRGEISQLHDEIERLARLASNIETAVFGPIPAEAPPPQVTLSDSWSLVDRLGASRGQLEDVSQVLLRIQENLG